MEFDKLILKFIWNCKGARLVQTTLQRNRVGRPTLFDFKNYYKVTEQENVLWA